MAIKEEILKAQEEAWNHKPQQTWQKHLMGPKELEHLFKEYEELRKLLEEHISSETMYRNIVNFLLSGDVPRSRIDELRARFKVED